MNHIEEEKLWKLYSEDISEEERTLLRTHLESCNLCMYEFQLIGLIHNDLHTIEKEEPSMRFAHTIMDRISFENQLDSSYIFWTRFTRHVLIIVVTVILVIIGLYIFVNDPSIPDEYAGVTIIKNELLLGSVSLWMFYLFDRFLNRLSHN